MSDDKHHYLILTWAEDPDDPGFGGELDWGITHPPACVYDAENYVWACGVGYEMENVGVMMLGLTESERLTDWGTLPAAFAIEFYAETDRYANGVEHTTGIRRVSGTEGAPQ